MSTITMQNTNAYLLVIHHTNGDRVEAIDAKSLRAARMRARLASLVHRNVPVTIALVRDRLEPLDERFTEALRWDLRR